MVLLPETPCNCKNAGNDGFLNNDQPFIGLCSRKENKFITPLVFSLFVLWIAIEPHESIYVHLFVDTE